jgi:hypothetical protein
MFPVKATSAGHAQSVSGQAAQRAAGRVEVEREARGIDARETNRMD